MDPRLTFSRVSWKWLWPGLVLVALLAAFFNPPDSGVTSGEFEYVQRVVDGNTLVLGTGERVGLIGVNTPETMPRIKIASPVVPGAWITAFP
jgi:hypothetical protein